MLNTAEISRYVCRETIPQLLLRLETGFFPSTPRYHLQSNSSQHHPHNITLTTINFNTNLSAPKMSERKVVSKYYPPTFDPSQLLPVRHRGKAAAPEAQQVRWAAPFSMQCTSCGEYIGKGRKFNARKLTLDENYLGAIQIYRLFIRCTRCVSPPSPIPHPLT